MRGSDDITALPRSACCRSRTERIVGPIITLTFIPTRANGWDGPALGAVLRHGPIRRPYADRETREYVLLQPSITLSWRSWSRELP